MPKPTLPSPARARDRGSADWLLVAWLVAPVCVLYGVVVYFAAQDLGWPLGVAATVGPLAWCAVTIDLIDRRTRQRDPKPQRQPLDLQPPRPDNRTFRVGPRATANPDRTTE